MKYYSQNGQDELIIKLFKHKENGFFLDIGAYDGIYFSNSLALEESLGWRGVCIEPNPLVFEKLKNNRKCTCLNFCISDKLAQLDFMAVSGWGEMLSGLTGFFDERHFERIDQIIEEHGGGKQVIKVEAFSLRDIIEKYAPVRIDYCNIDVEGGELSVLKSIDFSKVEIKVFTIENNYGSKDVWKYLKSHGYQLIATVGEDEVYELQSKRFLLLAGMKFKRIKKYLGLIKRNLKQRIN